MTKNERWILSEWLVAKDRTSRFNELLYYHREQTPFAEVDLVFGSRDPDAPVTVIEVKTVSAFSANHVWGREVISRRQVARLERARWHFEIRARKPVRLLLALVDPPGFAAFGTGTSKAGETRIRYFEAPFES